MTGNQQVVAVAPTWLRLVAGAADLSLVVAATAGALALWYGLVHASFPDRYWNYFDYAVDLLNSRPDLVWPPVIAFLAVQVAWGTLWPLLLGNTPAAAVVGMTLVTSSGSRPGPARTFARAVLSVACALCAGLGPLTALMDPRRRMLHDILTGCLVLAGRAPTPAGPSVPSKDAAGYAGGPRRLR